ncbi:MAG: radical SAM protein [Oscillospiraceae bacterium]|nr:radical SAM protein [Oscillospiraceae bacterium]
MPDELILTNIQHFSLGDGPGIRTTVFLKGCSLHCPWCHNPETISPDITPQYGRRCTVENIVEEILEDAAFYRESGGGVTLSGGEPLLQAAACARIGEACRSAGIPVLLDTAGNVGREAFETVLPWVDACYFDLKAGSQEGYDAVGGQLERVLANMSAAAAAGVPVTARIPVIPGFNDSPEEAERMARLLLEARIRRVDLLPFHRLGSGKYKTLGWRYAYADTLPPEPAKIRQLLEVYRRAGMEAGKGG